MPVSGQQMRAAGLAEAAAEKFQFANKAAARAAVDATLAAMADHLASGGILRLDGFGAFTVKDVPARMRLNPMTGDKFLAPATRRLHFKPSTPLMDRIKAGA